MRFEIEHVGRGFIIIETVLTNSFDSGFLKIDKKYIASTPEEARKYFDEWLKKETQFDGPESGH